MTTNLTIDVETNKYDPEIDYESDSDSDYPIHYSHSISQEIITNCLDNLICYDDTNVYGIELFKNYGMTLWTNVIYYCSCPECEEQHEICLIDKIINCKQFTPQAFDFAIKYNIIQINDMDFFERYTEKIINPSQWSVIFHIIKHIYTYEKIINWRDNDGNSLLVRLLKDSYWFDEMWFNSILEVMISYKLDITEKINKMYAHSLLDLAIDKLSPKIIKTLVKYGCKFTEGGKYLNCGISYNSLSTNNESWCDALQREIWYAYHNLSEIPDQKYQRKIFDTVKCCIMNGYDITTKDSHGFSLKNYIEKFITYEKHPEFYELYSEYI